VTLPGECAPVIALVYSTEIEIVIRRRKTTDRLSPCNHARVGTTLVEMAIVLSVFVMMVMGILEFGRSMMVNQILADGTRRGVRLSAFESTTNGDVVAAVQTFVANAAGVAARDVNVTITVTAAPGNADPGGQVANAEIGDLVTVQAQIAIDNVTWTPGSYLAGKRLTAVAAMRHE
jgi:Flp pilus assembly protein TadG